MIYSESDFTPNENESDDDDGSYANPLTRDNDYDLEDGFIVPDDDPECAGQEYIPEN